ncbi:MAG: DUF975 family protein [Rikenellaceae bacterium]
MIKTNSELRKSAMASLSGRWTEPVLAYAAYAAMVGVASALPGVSFVSVLITLPLFYGVSLIFLNHFRLSSYEAKVTDLFVGFKDYERIFVTLLLQTIYTILWSFVFVVPGIIKGLSYAMTPYILADEPELKNNGAIEKSMAMMKGYKMKLFLMCLNFAMWSFLSLFTFGILLLWVIPYCLTTLAAFYEDVKANYESNNVVIITA